MNIQIEKLMSQVEKKKEINDEDLLVRELLEICHINGDSCKINDLSKYSSRIFYRVYEELFKKNTKSKLIIKDMINSEFLDENLLTAPVYIDADDEIY